MKALKAAAGLILVLGLAGGFARQVAPALAEQATPNTIEGRVFLDENLDGQQNDGEPGSPKISLELYRDGNANGLIDRHDRRLAKTDTDESGRFAFSVAQVGAFLVKVDTKSLPKGSALTTLNRQEAVFTDLGQSDSDSNFGYTDAPYVDDEVLAQFAADVSKQRVKEILDGYGLKIKRHQERQQGVGFYLLITPPGEVDAVVEYLLTRYPDEVLLAERNGILAGTYEPTDPDYADPAKSYGLQRIQAETAWDATKGVTSTVVAIVDSGLSMMHPEFAGRFILGWDFVNGDADPSDDNGHGTHVSGIVAAAMDNGQGSTGVAPGVQIMPVKALGASNSGTWADVASGIIYAVDNGADVINLSLGGHVPSSVMYDAVLYAAAHDVLVVAGGGNLPDGEPFYPAAYPEVLAVSATNALDECWTSSNYGDWVDVAAPGDAIWSTLWTLAEPAAYGTKSGTSMATAFVSGLAGLISSARPDLSALDVKTLIEQTSDDKGDAGRDDFYGWGRVNAGAAVGITGAWVTVTPMPTATPTTTPTATPTPTNTPTPTPTPYLLRVNAGSASAYTDGLGQVWAADRAFVADAWGYVSGSAKSYTTLVAGTNDDPLYQKLREGLTQYRFTVPSGDYQVQLRFAEFAASKVGYRVMQISLEGTAVETGLDVFKMAGKAGALDRSYTVSVADGVLNISFAQVGGKYKPMVSAIEVRSGATVEPTPTPTSTLPASSYLQRVDSGSARDYTDGQGRVWNGDQVYDSMRAPTWGTSGASAESGVIGELYADYGLFETWVEGGKLGYKFDVSPGTYQVTLRFAELAVATAGARVMQISLEGGVIEPALDIYALVGGGAPLDRTYPIGVTDGQLNIDFAKADPGRKNPMVAAVEVAYAGPPPPPTATPTPTATATRTATPTATPYVMRVNTGGTTYTDKSALVWAADKAFSTGSWGYVGGKTGKSRTALPNTEDDTLYQTYRTAMTEYKFTVPNGTYEVRLRFAEFSTATIGARAMKIMMEGVVVDHALDVVALAPGKAVAFDRTYPVSVADGILNIGFARAAGASLDPVISGIEVR